jgi:hypothetical protein
VNPTNERESVCALPGTAPGTPCRATPGNACDPGLACNTPEPPSTRAECVPIRREGDTCDPSRHSAINQCATGLECCAVSDAGTTFYCRPAGTTPCYHGS